MLSENLVKTGINTEVYTTTANGNQELPVIPGVQVTVDGVPVTYFKRITGDHTHFSPALFNQLKKEIKNFDMVHIHAWWNLVSIFSCRIALNSGVPVLLSPRGTLSEYSFKNKSIGPKWLLHRLLGLRVLKKCFIHATTAQEAASISRLFRPKQLFVVPNFVKLPRQREYFSPDESSVLRLVFFSRIEEKKGLDLLIEALPMITIPFNLTIAGDGKAEYVELLKNMAAANGSADKIMWIGFQSDNKFDILQQHDLFVLPSYDENFGNAVIESLSVGTPVLISNKVGLADYVSENNLGWICHINAESIAWEINNIFAERRADLKKIRERAPQVIYHDFEPDNLAGCYINMYKELVAQ